MKLFRRVLVANRGEIACRIMRTLKVLGIEAVAVCSEADRDALHVREADRVVEIGPAPAAQSYLDSAKILEAARSTRAEAIHPGYGFLSENAVFAAACKDAGIKFIGPDAAAIGKLGDKQAAREIAMSVGVDVVPGAAMGAGGDPAALAEQVGFPMLVKAAAGGGGKGMRRVDRLADLPAAIEGARREALAAFKSDALIVERYVEGARHIEVQVLGDQRGEVVPVMERDCTMQRRHQKVIEECPSPRVDAALRKRLLEAATRLSGAARYESAGTLEFLLTPKGEIFFLEMNTRLQVEHPVTELVCGLDLVAWQIAIAAGLTFAERRPVVDPRGSAIEARIYAEDAAAGFLPQTGTLRLVRWPSGPGIRVDAGVATGSVVSPHYDPMLAKVIAWGGSREEARARLVQALRETVLVGMTTNLPFLVAALQSERFRRGEYDTTSIERGEFASGEPEGELPDDVLMLAAFGLDRGAATIGSTPRAASPAVPSGPWTDGGAFRIGGSARG